MKPSEVIGFTRDIFRILQLLCENQNDQMRDYLRFQADNLIPVNMIQEVMNYLEVLSEEMTEDILETVEQALDTLNEMSMNSHPNKIVLFESKGYFSSSFEIKNRNKK